MRSNASTFRSFNYVEDQMIRASMPRLAALEAVGVPSEPESRPSTLRVSVAEVAGTRLYGFRTVQEVQ